MKSALMALATVLSVSNNCLAAFSCKVWNDPVGSGDRFEFELKPVSPSEPYMLEGKIHDLTISTMIAESKKSYEVQAVEKADLERGFFVRADVIFFPDAKVSFHYPVKALNDVIALNVQCTK